MAVSLPLITNADEGPPTRFPVLKTGSITSDEIWSEDVFVVNVTIHPNVKVTVQAGVTVYMDQLTSLYLHGELVIAGTVEEKVEIRCLPDSGEWRSIEIGSTGKVDLQNVTITDTSNDNTPVINNGLPSHFNNVELEGGYQGIFFSNEGGDHIRNLKVYNATNFGVVLVNTVNPIHISNLTTNSSQWGSVGMDNSAGCNINGLTASNHDGSFVTIWGATSVLISNFSFRNPTFDINRKGFELNGHCEVDLKNGVLENCQTGIFLNSASADTKVNFMDVDLEKTSNSVFFSSNSGGALKFVNCDLSAEEETMIMNGSTNPQRVEFINTTWNAGSPNELAGDAYLNVSWNMDVSIADGIGRPINSRLTIQPSGGGPLNQMDSNVGEFNKVLMKDRSIDPSGYDLLYLYDLTFISNDHPGEFQTVEDHHVGEYTLWEIEINLPPSNDLPGTLDVDEDQWLELDLYDHFIDPEGEVMEFKFNISSSLDLVQTGGSTSGDIKFRNKQPDWHGIGWVEITATDSGGKTTTANATVEVHAVNDGPRFTAEIPEFEIMEEGTGYFNFTGVVTDPEGDAITWTIPDAEGLDLDWDEDHWNLTFTGVENWFGLTGIDVNITDGTYWSIDHIVVNVTPVNDIPTWSLMLKNGTEAPLVEYFHNETTNWTVYLIETDEDLPVEFWINASDAEGAELLYSFVGAYLVHGAIEVEMYQIEVIVNATTNETEMQNVTVPMNFTYTPMENDFLGDLVLFNVSDGEDTMSCAVWFKVAPVNDLPVFTAPSEWNITADLDTLATIDMAGWISDVDGDTLTISTDSEYVTVNGTILEILYNDTFVDDLQTVTVTVGDGTMEITAILTVNVNQPATGDDDPALGTLEVKSKDDGWLFEVEGDEGQTLFVVIEDEDGNQTSYPMTYADGKYSVKVEEDEAEAGLIYHLSNEEDGGSLGPDQAGSLTDLESDSEEDGSFLWIIILLIIVILFLILAIALVMMKSKGKDEFEE
ncbi:MAG: hypothetical protein KAH57_00935 [Thermoplasmata archaeon]|nr:hypothetical protein [Thermoplasmata archaeon]